jgi:hypothetical protein
MTPFHQACLYFGLAVATIAFCVAFFHAVPAISGLIGRFCKYVGRLADNQPGRFVCPGFFSGLAGFCVLCASTTWLRITDAHLFAAGIALIVLCATAFLATK